MKRWDLNPIAHSLQTFQIIVELQMNPPSVFHISIKQFAERKKLKTTKIYINDV